MEYTPKRKGLATPKTQARSASKTHPSPPAIRSPPRPRQPSAASSPQAETTTHQPSAHTTVASAGPASPDTHLAVCSRHTGWHRLCPGSSGPPARADCDHPCAAASNQTTRQYCAPHPPTCTHRPRPRTSSKRNAPVTAQPIPCIPLDTRPVHQSSGSSPAPDELTSHVVPRCASSP